jgi:formamidopyrimidine-DNA glycosylase
VPELPEVEILARHLDSALKGRRIVGVKILREKSVLPQSPDDLSRCLVGARFAGVRRRAKFILFDLNLPRKGSRVVLVGHLGMTGRMFIRPDVGAPSKHIIATLDLDRGQFVFEDVRRFGRLNLDTSPLDKLGPEPLDASFTPAVLKAQLGPSSQSIKVKLLDQETVAGIGNIYASEALWVAGISPRKPAGRLTSAEVAKLTAAIRSELERAILLGARASLDFAGRADSDGLFYYGSDGGAQPEERFKVYDRAGISCERCGEAILRVVQAARSTFYCPRCQRGP